MLVNNKQDKSSAYFKILTPRDGAHNSFLNMEIVVNNSIPKPYIQNLKATRFKYLNFNCLCIFIVETSTDASHLPSFISKY